MSAAIKTLDKQNTSVQGMFDRVGAWVDDVLQRRKNIGTITELPLSSRAIQTVIDAALIDRRLTKKKRVRWSDLSSENERLKATVKGPDEDADALGEEVLADVLRDLDTAAINRANTHDMVDQSAQTGGGVEEDEETLILRSLRSGKYAFLRRLGVEGDALVGKHEDTQTEDEGQPSDTTRNATEAAVGAEGVQTAEAFTQDESVPNPKTDAECETEAALVGPSLHWLEEHSKAAQVKGETLVERKPAVDCGLDPLRPPPNELLERSRLVQTASKELEDSGFDPIWPPVSEVLERSRLLQTESMTSYDERGLDPIPPPISELMARSLPIQTESLYPLVDSGFDPMWPLENDLIDRSRLVQTEREATARLVDANTQTSLAPEKCDREVCANQRDCCADVEVLTDEAALHAKKRATGNNWFLLFNMAIREVATQTETGGSASRETQTGGDLFARTRSAEVQTNVQSALMEAGVTQTEERGSVESTCTQTDTDLLLFCPPPEDCRDASTDTADGARLLRRSDVREEGVQVAIARESRSVALAAGAPTLQRASRRTSTSGLNVSIAAACQIEAPITRSSGTQTYQQVHTSCDAACMTGPELVRSQDEACETERPESSRNAHVQTDGRGAHLHAAHTQTDPQAVRLTEHMCLQTSSDAVTRIAPFDGVSPREPAGRQVTQKFAALLTDESLAKRQEVDVRETLEAQRKTVGVKSDLLGFSAARVHDNNVLLPTFLDLPPLKIRDTAALLKKNFLQSVESKRGVSGVGSSGICFSGNLPVRIAGREDRSVETDLRVPIDEKGLLEVLLVPRSSLYQKATNCSEAKHAAEAAAGATDRGSWASQSLPSPARMQSSGESTPTAKANAKVKRWHSGILVSVPTLEDREITWGPDELVDSDGILVYVPAFEGRTPGNRANARGSGERDASDSSFRGASWPRASRVRFRSQDNVMQRQLHSTFQSDSSTSAATLTVAPPAKAMASAKGTGVEAKGNEPNGSCCLPADSYLTILVLPAGAPFDAKPAAASRGAGAGTGASAAEEEGPNRLTTCSVSVAAAAASTASRAAGGMQRESAFEGLQYKPKQVHLSQVYANPNSKEEFSKSSQAEGTHSNPNYTSAAGLVLQPPFGSTYSSSTRSNSVPRVSEVLESRTEKTAANSVNANGFTRGAESLDQSDQSDETFVAGLQALLRRTLSGARSDRVDSKATTPSASLENDLSGQNSRLSDLKYSSSPFSTSIVTFSSQRVEPEWPQTPLESEKTPAAEEHSAAIKAVAATVASGGRPLDSVDSLTRRSSEWLSSRDSLTSDMSDRDISPVQRGSDMSVGGQNMIDIDVRSNKRSMDCMTPLTDVNPSHERTLSSTTTIDDNGTVYADTAFLESLLQNAGSVVNQKSAAGSRLESSSSYSRESLDSTGSGRGSHKKSSLVVFPSDMQRNQSTGSGDGDRTRSSSSDSRAQETASRATSCDDVTLRPRTLEPLEVEVWKEGDLISYDSDDAPSPYSRRASTIADAQCRMPQQPVAPEGGGPLSAADGDRVRNISAASPASSHSTSIHHPFENFDTGTVIRWSPNKAGEDVKSAASAAPATSFRVQNQQNPVYANFESSMPHVDQLPTWPRVDDAPDELSEELLSLSDVWHGSNADEHLMPLSPLGSVSISFSEDNCSVGGAQTFISSPVSRIATAAQTKRDGVERSLPVRTLEPVTSGAAVSAGASASASGKFTPLQRVSLEGEKMNEGRRTAEQQVTSTLHMPDPILDRRELEGGCTERPPPLPPKPKRSSAASIPAPTRTPTGPSTYLLSGVFTALPGSGDGDRRGRVEHGPGAAAGPSSWCSLPNNRQ